MSDRVTLGRAGDSDIQILHPEVSRRHAKIKRDDDGSFVLIDLASDNGTLVANERIDRHTLRPGDSFCIHKSIFVFEHAEEPVSTSAVFSSRVRSFDAMKPTQTLAVVVPSDSGTMRDVIVTEVKNVEIGLEVAMEDEPANDPFEPELEDNPTAFFHVPTKSRVAGLEGAPWAIDDDDESSSSEDAPQRTLDEQPTAALPASEPEAAPAPGVAEPLEPELGSLETSLDERVAAAESLTEDFESEEVATRRFRIPVSKDQGDDTAELVRNESTLMVLGEIYEFRSLHALRMRAELEPEREDRYQALGARLCWPTHEFPAKERNFRLVGSQVPIRLIQRDGAYERAIEVDIDEISVSRAQLILSDPAIRMGDQVALSIDLSPLQQSQAELVLECQVEWVRRQPEPGKVGVAFSGQVDYVARAAR